MAEAECSTKQCSRCKDIKPASEFHKDKTKRLGLSSTCKDCACKRSGAWYRDNPEKAAASRRRHYLEHKEEYRTHSSEYYRTHKKRHLELSKAWVASHRERAAELARRLYARDLPKNRARKIRYQAVRRARIVGAGGSFTQEDVERIRSSQHDKCAACRCKLKGKFHIDHIQPVSKGGSSAARNLQLLCMTCNVRKHAKDPIAFMQEIGRLL